MKLRNKKTGEIGNLVLNINPNRESYSVLSTENGDTVCGNLVLADYNSLAELNEEWEDYEEPKGDIWWLDNEGNVHHATSEVDDNFEKNREIGNYFETKEEAEKAVEKLKALANLRKRGLKFNGWGSADRGLVGEFEIYCDAVNLDGIEQELELLFGREEI